MQEVILAKSAGFCFGVRRAVEMAQALAESGKPYVMLGPVIHNQEVIRDLEARGVGCVDSLEALPPDCGVIIRSHGEGQAVHRRLREMGREVADATCVKVTKIHRIVEGASRRGRQVIIIGEAEHPEVKAIAGFPNRGGVGRFSPGKGRKPPKTYHHGFPNYINP